MVATLFGAVVWVSEIKGDAGFVGEVFALQRLFDEVWIDQTFLDSGNR